MQALPMDATREAAKLHRRAEQKILRAKTREVARIMKDHPRTVDHLHVTAISLIGSDQVLDASPKPLVNIWTTNKIPDGYFQFSYFSVIWLQRILSDINDVTLAVYFTKRLSIRGNRDASKYSLLELLEFLTGKAPSDPVATYAYDELLDELKMLHVARGNPATNVSIPYDMGKNGVFRLEKRGSTPWLLQHVGSGHLPDPLALDSKILGGKVGMSRIKILNNHSEARAVLSIPGRDCSKMLCCVLMSRGATQEPDEKTDWQGDDEVCTSGVEKSEGVKRRRKKRSSTVGRKRKDSHLVLAASACDEGDDDDMDKNCAVVPSTLASPSCIENGAQPKICSDAALTCPEQVQVTTHIVSSSALADKSALVAAGASKGEVAAAEIDACLATQRKDVIVIETIRRSPVLDAEAIDAATKAPTSEVASLASHGVGVQTKRKVALRRCGGDASLELQFQPPPPAA